MKERPIIFNAPMVRAILEGRKTQTRRIVKVQPPSEGYTLSTLIDTTGQRRNRGKHNWLKIDGYKVVDGPQHYLSRPYDVGDRLWVKERFNPVYSEDDDVLPGYPSMFEYAADDTSGTEKPWNSPRFMPRWASRITLEVTGVRVERLQDISEDDAIAEGGGKDCPIGHIPSYMKSPFKYCFDVTWDSIHGPGAWEKNPWVWVVEFKRVGEK